MSALNEFSSVYNQITGDTPLHTNIEIHDLTLEADGEEMAGLRFTHQERISIAKKLEEVGIHRISILGNSPKPTPGEIRSAEAIVDLNLNLKVGAFVKTCNEVKLCAKIGLSGVTVLVGVNDHVLTKGRTTQDIIYDCKSLTSLARENGLHVTLMGMDSTRASPGFLQKLVTELDPFFDEYVIADSLGRITPFGIRNLASLVGQWTTKPLQLHCHNTTSMAVANCLGSVLGGVSILQTAVNGLGEFTGIPPTEECAVALEMHTTSSLGLNLPKLQELSHLVSKITSIHPSPNKPVTGSGAFAVPETEEIQKVMYELYCENRYEEALPFPAGLVGANAYMSIGRKCNSYTVLYNLAICGHKISMTDAKDFAKEIREHLKKRKGYVLISNEQFIQLFKEWSSR